MRGDPQDPERLPRSPTEGLPLFPTDTAAIRYAKWRITPEGGRVFAWILEAALARVDAGERRVGSKSLVERCRDELHLHIDNAFTPLIGRELITRSPKLKHFVTTKARAVG